MENLKVVELTQSELKQVDGGYVLGPLGLLALGYLLTLSPEEIMEPLGEGFRDGHNSV